MKKHAATCCLSLSTVLLFSLTLAASWPAYFNRTAQEDWSQATRVVRTLNLKRGQRVADIGAGGGYFSVLLARAVGPGGRVYAVDISPASIRHIRQYAAARKALNVIPLLAAADNPGLQDGSVDLVFIRNTYHHLGDRVSYFRRLKRSLRTAGRVAIIDFHPHVYHDHSTSEKIIAAEMAAAGYRRVARFAFLARQNFNVFVVGK